MSEYKVAVWEKCWIRYTYTVSAESKEAAVAAYGTDAVLGDYEIGLIENTGEIDTEYTEVEEVSE